jgi:hypothetical protein
MTLVLGLLAPAASIADCRRQEVLTHAADTRLTQIFRNLLVSRTTTMLSDAERDVADGWPIVATLLHRRSRTYLVLFRSDRMTGKTVAAFFWVEAVEGWREGFNFLVVEATGAYWTPNPAAATLPGQLEPGPSDQVENATRGILLQGYVSDAFPHPQLVLAWSSGKPGSQKIETAHPMIHVDPIVDCEGFWARLGPAVSAGAFGTSAPHPPAREARPGR